MADLTMLLTAIANNQAFIEQMKARLASHQEEIKTNHTKVDAKIDANLKEIIEVMRAWRKEVKASREVTEAYPEKMEANPEEMKSEVDHEEVPKEEATVKRVRALKKRLEDRHLAVGCHVQLRKWTQADGGSWKKLATTHRGVTCCAGVVWYKGHGHTGPIGEQR
jgi:hypothetical protein